jgi:hypothetical protein
MFSVFAKANLLARWVVFAVLVSSLVSACNLEELIQQVTKGKVDSAAVARLKTYAGTYPVQPLRGLHARGNVVLGADGSIDFDSATVFALSHYQAVVDTVVAGDTEGGYHFRIDIKPFGGQPLRRVKLYVDTTLRLLLKAAYYPDVLNRPDSAVVVGKVLIAL